jgi:hypothetical protein
MHGGAGFNRSVTSMSAQNARAVGASDGASYGPSYTPSNGAR